MNFRKIRFLLLAGGFLTLIGLLRLSPLGELCSDPKRLAQLGAAAADSAWMPIIAIGTYSVAAVFLFPVTVLFFATAYLFDPLPGMLVALCGTASSGAMGYMAGNVLGSERIKARIAVPYKRLSALSDNHGVLWVAMVRHVPIAPFTIVNMAIGCTPVTLPQFIFGTVLGLAPSIALIIILRQGLSGVSGGAHPAELGLLFGAGVLFILMVVSTKRILRSRFNRK